MKHPESVRVEAIRLRVEERLAILPISKRLKISHGIVGLWLKDYPLSTLEVKEKQSGGYKSHSCKYCGDTKADNFYSSIGLKSVCKKCHTAYSYQRKRELKLKSIEYLGGRCSICKCVGCAAIYDFHHKTDETKEFNVSDSRGSWETIKLELDKCILVCSNCHRTLHHNIWLEGLDKNHPEYLRKI